MAKLNLRVEITENGAIITNRATQQKTVNRSTAPAIELVKNFIQDAMANEEPGQYFDVDLSVQPQRIKKVS